MAKNKLSSLLDGQIEEESENQNNSTPEMVTNVDPNSVIVDIRSKAPIVVFFGPTNIGKTVALIRLSKYLMDNNYIVEPDKNFRKEDLEYHKLCEKFIKEYIKNPVAPQGTSQIDFLLLKIRKESGDICQLLEAPGEHYFDEKNPKAIYPPYFSSIRSNNIPKVYVIFLEIGWGASKNVQDDYSDKISNLITGINNNDYIILLANKADEKPEYIHKGKPQINEFKKEIKDEYPKVFEKLGNKGFFKSLFSAESHRNTFIVFSAGSFKERADGGKTFTEGNDYYPSELWQAITKGIRGIWK